MEKTENWKTDSSEEATSVALFAKYKEEKWTPSLSKKYQTAASDHHLHRINALLTVDWSRDLIARVQDYAEKAHKTSDNAVAAHEKTIAMFRKMMESLPKGYANVFWQKVKPLLLKNVVPDSWEKLNLTSMKIQSGRSHQIMACSAIMRDPEAAKVLKKCLMCITGWGCRFIVTNQGPCQYLTFDDC